ncbi:hypothetical protein GCM10009564_07080 [Streptomyces thermogriseus]|uniref:Uncharacterized protein n=1 Tax=Streptomyces thermogriseus TaxID=75292 RepID=A0ABP4DAA8_9ACTN
MDGRFRPAERLKGGGTGTVRRARGTAPHREGARPGRRVPSAPRAARAASARHRDAEPADVPLRTDGTAAGPWGRRRAGGREQRAEEGRGGPREEQRRSRGAGGPWGQRRRRWRAMAAAVPPATAPTPAAAGMPTLAALRPVR